MGELAENIVELEIYRNSARVFRDRQHAGEILAEMLVAYKDSDALILGIAAGGVPVAAAIARQHLALNILIVKKITPPDNSEFGYGALAWDGEIQINRDVVAQLGLSEADVERGIEVARNKVEARIKKFQIEDNLPEIKGRSLLLVDDGLATGTTFNTCIQSLRNQGATKIIGAVPTAHAQSAISTAKTLDALYCANIRTGYRYAVAEAYKYWHDVPDSEVLDIIQSNSMGNFLNTSDPAQKTGGGSI